MKKKLKNGITVYIIVVILIILVAIIRYVSNFDLLGWKLFNCEWFGKLFNEGEIFSCWPLSHFILYVIIGYISPDYWLLWFIVGIIWEFIEFIVSKVIQNMCNKNHNNIESEKNYTDLWRRKDPSFKKSISI